MLLAAHKGLPREPDGIQRCSGVIHFFWGRGWGFPYMCSMTTKA